ncbi:MAG: cobaltochelatase subunit CobN [Candidatus Omnitrophica bacterium]|nr:cobaltochelatase subunit CobN [Candidatus Omnitrophota bacterium]
MGFVNFADHQFAHILEVNDNPFVRVHRIDFKNDKDLKLKKYDAIYFFAHAINLSKGQVEEIKEAGKGGTKLYMLGLIQGDVDFGNLTGKDLEHVKSYLENGGQKNLRALLNYSRRIFDHKMFFSRQVDNPKIYPKEGLFYLGEEDTFVTYDEYQKFYKDKGYYRESAPRIAFVTSILDRNEAKGLYEPLIDDFKRRGLNVYPVFGVSKRVEFLKQINPSLVVLIPHGRLASDESVEWLKKQNVPMLAPLVVFEEYDKWLKDQRGMDGGMLSQSVVMPEVDGGVYPYAIAAQFTNDKGLKVFKVLPNRLEVFGNLIERWLRLKQLSNAEKKVAIYYYKGAGENAMVAEGLEIAPSLLNVLRRLKEEGYATGELPENEDALLKRIQNEGRILGPYAKGAFEDYIKNGDPVLIEKDQFLEWMKKYLQPEMVADVERDYGQPLGEYMTVEKDGRSYISVARVQFGNVVLIPVPMAGYGDDEYKLVHGVKKAPPYPYLAAYIWGLRGFEADAFIHFGTHGSVEFTPWKQNALSEYDWPDALLSGIPHFYLYSISNIGEALIAKRRSYATMMTHITPPFTEAGLYSDLAVLHEKTHGFKDIQDEALKEEYRETIRELALKTDIHKDLGLDNLEKEPQVSDETIDKICHYVHSLTNQKITRGLYTLGERYKDDHIYETVRLIAVDYLAHALEEMDTAQGRKIAPEELAEHELEDYYRDHAFDIIDEILFQHVSPEYFLDLENLGHLALAHSQEGHAHSHDHGIHEHEHGAEEDHTHGEAHEEHGHEDHDHHHEKALTPLNQQKFDAAYQLYKSTLLSLKDYYTAVETSPHIEMNTIVNALSGGYTAPASGGDPIVNPNSIPAGRNTYGIDAEKTPTEEAWKVGVKLAQQLIEIKQKETGVYPKKVAFTLWSSEFVREQGTTIAEIFYLLGVEPVRNARGSVYDVRLIPIEELKRPRIDVIVQTSGQFRDLAASRIYLINKAVQLAANAKDNGEYENYAKEGTLLAEKVMKEKGVSPEEARELANIRVFGGANGNYGTAIMEMVEKGDSWEKEEEVARQYLQNMGAMYDKGHWSEFKPGMFEAAIQNTDTLVQPRSANTWGPLSLDHVYEFMGGLNNAIHYVTGNDPAAYFSDLRNKNRPVIQSAKEAIWVEARTTMLNPKYIADLQKGGASSAEVFAETIRDTYGWDVMKPKVIDEELWDGLYEVYVKDKYQLGVEKFFREKNPYALQEITAVMLEVVRKGYWQPGEQVVKDIAALHAQLVKDHKAGCSVFVCNNAKLREMISQKLNSELKKDYLEQINSARLANPSEKKEGIQLEKEKLDFNKVKEKVRENISIVIAMLAIVGLVIVAVISGARLKRT